MKNKPVFIEGTEIIIQFDKDMFSKKEVLITSTGVQMIVTKVYKYTWWKKILLFLGFRVKFYQVKVKQI